MLQERPFSLPLLGIRPFFAAFTAALLLLFLLSFLPNLFGLLVGLSLFPCRPWQLSSSRIRTHTRTTSRRLLASSPFCWCLWRRLPINTTVVLVLPSFLSLSLFLPSVIGEGETHFVATILERYKACFTDT